MQNDNTTPQLAKSLSPLMIWGLGVGYVISGEYFGWNLGLEHGGPLWDAGRHTDCHGDVRSIRAQLRGAGMRHPKAGGAFVYAQRAFGPRIGMLAGTAQWIEFVFAPPAIAFAIGSYFSNFTGSPPWL